MDDDFYSADWWYSTLDPDYSDPDQPFNVIHAGFSYGVVVEVVAAKVVGRKHGFILPAADDAEDDDDREFWFDTKEEAEAELARLAGQP